MKSFLLFLLCVPVVHSADVVNVDPAGVTTITGAMPPAPPTAGEVKIGGGQVHAQGAVIAGEVLVKRQSQAVGEQAVRGDDPRLAVIGLPVGYKAYTSPGNYTFTIGVDCPASTTAIYACVIGGGGGSGGSKPPGDYTSVWIPGGNGGSGGRLMCRIPIIQSQSNLQLLVGGFGTGGNGGGISGNQAKDNQGGGGGGGGSQLVYNGISYTAGGGGGGGGAKSGSYTGYANRGGNGGAAMLNGETVTAGQAGGLGATIGVTLNGGVGGQGGVNAAPYQGQPGGGGTSGGFIDDHFWFLFGPYEIGTAGTGGQPNLTSSAWGSPGGSGNAGAIILRW